MKPNRTVYTLDERFRTRRERSRREDAAALASGKRTPNELQRANSIFPENFRTDVKIDWKKLAYGTSAHG